MGGTFDLKFNRKEGVGLYVFSGVLGADVPQTACSKDT